MVHQLLPGSYSIFRAFELRAGKSHLEQVLQHFYPLELRCNRKMSQEENENQLDINRKQFRPRQNASAIAAVKVNDQFKNEHEVPNID